MDIQTAARYMKHGYRIRRASWTDEPIKWLDIWKWEDGEPFPLYLDELLADDWEIITEGIVADFPLTTYSDD